MAAVNTYVDTIQTTLADLTGKISASAVVLGSGALATAMVASTSILAGATMAASTAIVNRNQPSEKQINVAQSALDVIQYTGTTGMQAFNTVRPMLFSATHKATSTSALMAMQAAGFILTQAYNGVAYAASTAQYVYENTHFSDLGIHTPEIFNKLVAY
jgi:hypothetical protein